MNKSFILFTAFLFVLINNLAAQGDSAAKADYFKENYIRYEDHIYKEGIKTVLLHRQGFELSEPLLILGSPEKLLLSFDELDAQVQRYHYTFIHCSSDWKPTDINSRKVMEGYEDDYIQDYRTSNNTLQAYVHYELAFPNENIQLKLSGNYIILVYADEDKENPLLTARFSIVEQKMTIKAEIRRANSMDDMAFEQKVDFSLLARGINLIDPYRNLEVIVRQNKRWDNAITNLKPMMVKGDELDYHHDFGNVFNGGNEFRYFDSKSIKYNSERVSRIDHGEHLYEFFVNPDLKRNTKVYITEEDINGRYLIKTVDARDPAVDGDYVIVHFSVPYSPPFIDGSLYLMGGLTYWQFSNTNKMVYNFNTKSYDLSLLLKQGYYNYQYFFLGNGRLSGDETRIEGSHFEAENEYDIFVYYKDPAAEYQRLVGWQVVASRKK